MKIGREWSVKVGRAGVCEFGERECISGDGVVRKCGGGGQSEKVKCESGDRVEHKSRERVERMVERESGA